jgi:hypothetical protein
MPRALVSGKKLASRPDIRKAKLRRAAVVNSRRQMRCPFKFEGTHQLQLSKSRNSNDFSNKLPDGSHQLGSTHHDQRDYNRDIETFGQKMPSLTLQGALLCDQLIAKSRCR